MISNLEGFVSTEDDGDSGKHTIPQLKNRRRVRNQRRSASLDVTRRERFEKFKSIGFRARSPVKMVGIGAIVIIGAVILGIAMIAYILYRLEFDE